MEYEAAGEEEGAPAKIKGFTPKLTDKKLIRIDNSWYASDETHGTRLPEEIDPKEVFKEGASKTVTVNQYERSAVARAKCLAHHGYKCAVCSFNFEETYGEIGKEYELNPVTDLVPVCPNCHAMIHITRPSLSIKQLRQAIESRT